MQSNVIPAGAANPSTSRRLTLVPPRIQPTALDRLDNHLRGLQRHLLAVGRRAEAAALRTDLALLDEARRETAA
jgi:hypothetical protein